MESSRACPSVACAALSGPPGCLSIDGLGSTFVQHGELGIARASSECFTHVVDLMLKCHDSIGRTSSLPFTVDSAPAHEHKTIESLSDAHASHILRIANGRSQGAFVCCSLGSLVAVQHYVHAVLAQLQNANVKMLLVLAERVDDYASESEEMSDKIQNEMVFLSYLPGWTRIDTASELTLSDARENGGRPATASQFLLAELAASIGATAKYGT